MNHARRRAGLTLGETVATLAAVVTITALTVPALSGVGSASGTLTSHANLTVIGAAHLMYAADYEDRQVTWLPDEIAEYGDTAQSAFNAWIVSGGDEPRVWLGWGLADGGWVGEFFIASASAIGEPISFTTGFGTFRAMAARPIHDYVGGRYFDPTFFPPNDVVAHAQVEPSFDEPWEWVRVGYGGLDWSSYATSPAARYDPAVMAPPSAGGWVDPWTTDTGLVVPRLSEALYPNLKTHVIEHHWNQNAPIDPCNPGFSGGSYGGCEPYYFNHALDSSPVTLFYDGSVRILSNTEASAADALVLDQNGDGLWNRTTPMGASGYFGDQSYDGLLLSHHVLTNDGIRGRDTIAGTAGATPVAPGAPNTALRRRAPMPYPGRGVRAVAE